MGALEFVKKWFGFNGWKELSTSKRVGTQILSRVAFVAGLAVFIMLYVFVAGDDPQLPGLCGLAAIWFLIFQFFVNLIFVNSS